MLLGANRRERRSPFALKLVRPTEAGRRGRPGTPRSCARRIEAGAARPRLYDLRQHCRRREVQAFRLPLHEGDHFLSKVEPVPGEQARAVCGAAFRSGADRLPAVPVVRIAYPPAQGRTLTPADPAPRQDVRAVVLEAQLTALDQPTAARNGARDLRAWLPAHAGSLCCKEPLQAQTHRARSPSPLEPHKARLLDGGFDSVLEVTFGGSAIVYTSIHGLFLDLTEVGKFSLEPIPETACSRTGSSKGVDGQGRAAIGGLDVRGDRPDRSGQACPGPHRVRAPLERIDANGRASPGALSRAGAAQAERP